MDTWPAELTVSEDLFVFRRLFYTSKRCSGARPPRRVARQLCLSPEERLADWATKTGRRGESKFLNSPSVCTQRALQLRLLFRRAIRELVGEFECLVTFQWMPQAWRDHRRPLDSHLQV